MILSIRGVRIICLIGRIVRSGDEGAIGAVGSVRGVAFVSVVCSWWDRSGESEGCHYGSEEEGVVHGERDWEAAGSLWKGEALGEGDRIVDE